MSHAPDGSLRRILLSAPWEETCSLEGTMRTRPPRTQGGSRESLSSLRTCCRQPLASVQAVAGHLTPVEQPGSWERWWSGGVGLLMALPSLDLCSLQVTLGPCNWECAASLVSYPSVPSSLPHRTSHYSWINITHVPHPRFALVSLPFT